MKNGEKTRRSLFLTLLFAIISIGYVYPVVLVLLNSFKINHLRLACPAGKAGALLTEAPWAGACCGWRTARFAPRSKTSSAPVPSSRH